MQSQFEPIMQEDCNQFRELFKRYKNKRVEDIEELQKISTQALILAQRWCEIQSNASVLAKEKDIAKSDFQQWAYQHYRNLQEMHIDCRSLHRSSRDDLKANLLTDGG